MARIAFLLDGEEGHLLPSFKLARALGAAGHEVWFLSFPAAAAQIVGQGFRFLPVYADLLPEGARQLSTTALQSAVMAAVIRHRALDTTIDALRPDVVIALSLLWNHALVLACRNRLRIVLLSVFYWKESRRERYRRAAGLLMHMEDAAFELIQVLRSGGAPARTLDDVAEAVLRMPEIVLMPPELAAREPSPDDPLLFYTGVGVEPRRDGAAFDWSRIDAGRTLVYCSLGGQTDLAPALSRSFFAAVIDAMATRDDLVAIVATGRRLTLTEPCDHVANVRVVGWAPQTEILSKARVMLTHGGLGSVQECVSMGVPMIVCPVGRDQFDMAELVTKHGMGLSIPAGQATAATLLPLVDRVLTGRAFAASVARMREAFRRSTLNEAVRVIEATLDGRLAPAARCETGST